MSLPQIIDLQITVSDKAPSQPNFGTPLIAAYHTAWLPRVKEYTDADELLTDGFTTDSPVYKAAVAVKSQTPSPATFKVGRLANPYVQTVQLIVESAVEGTVLSGEINGTAITYTVLAGATLTTVATALELLVEAVTGIASTSAVDTVTAVSGSGLISSFYFERGVKILDATTDPGLAADLAAIKAEDDDWYGLLLACNSGANILAAATWAEAAKKIFIAQSSDWDVVDAAQTNDVASDLLALNFTRTAGIYHRGIGRTNDWTAAAWMGACLAADPGSITWAFKTLAGTSVDVLRAGEESSLAAKNWSYYQTLGGLSVTFEGRTGSDRFIDVTHFVDWLYATIQLDAWLLIANAPKIQYAAAGLSAIKGSVENSLAKGKKNPNPGLDPDFQSIVIVPGVAEQATADRANRIVRGIEFDDRLSGALHGLILRGRLSV
jgi:hypothetical protein